MDWDLRVPMNYKVAVFVNTEIARTMGKADQSLHRILWQPDLVRSNIKRDQTHPPEVYLAVVPWRM
jgi:hypothetical protein